ncbi:MAG TPA: hypothetical protein VGQ76_25370 [Thermoanaerobaculia bacterium]|jgi:hypothetical protein|nr:hypothetical protein [Thermoanaerobaculia bacterium]
MTEVIAEENPFVGPHPITRGRPLYGRDVEAAELTERLIANRIVLLHSPSGAGKTSLLGAKVGPSLEDRRQPFVVLPMMRVAGDTTRETRNPLLQNVFDRLPEDYRGDAELSDTFVDFIDRVTERCGADTPLLLVFDQFEELLTYDFTEEARVEFLRDVGQVLSSPMRWAVFAMREEFVPRMEALFIDIPTQLRTRFRLDLLTLAQSQTVVEQTARFTEGSIDRLVNDLQRGGYVEPLHLQVVGRRLWEVGRNDQGEITVAEGTASVSVSAALRAYYREHVGRIAKNYGADERRLRAWVGSELIVGRFRRPAAHSPDVANVKEVLKELEDAYLLRSDPRPGRQGWLELAHDRLVEPIIDDNRGWLQETLSEFELAAMLWDTHQRPSHLLFPARKLRTEKPPTEPGVEADFYKASRREATNIVIGLATFGAVLLMFIGFSIFATRMWFENKRLLEANQKLSADLEKEIKGRNALTAFAAAGVSNAGSVGPAQKSTATEFLVDQFGWSQVDAQRINTAAVVQVQTADGLVDVLLARVRPRSAPIRVDYFATEEMSANRENVIKAMKDIMGDRYTIRARDSMRTGPMKTNIIFYGKNIEPDDVRLIALLLIRAGLPLTSMTPISGNVIQIGVHPQLTGPALTPEDIMGESLTDLDRAAQQAEARRQLPPAAAE